MISPDFRVEICGDLEYKDLTADVYFKDECVAMLTQETGFENLEIAIYPPENQERWQFKYSEFERVLQYAKQRLWELRKSPEEEQRTP